MFDQSLDLNSKRNNEPSFPKFNKMKDPQCWITAN
jgi:hypothetical protein